MKRGLYFHPKRKKRAKKKLKQGPFNLVKYHQFPFLYEDSDEEELMDLDEEGSYFSHSKHKQGLYRGPINLGKQINKLAKKQIRISPSFRLDLS